MFTNTERRVNLVRKVMEPHGDSKPDLWIFNELAKRFEQGRRSDFPKPQPRCSTRCASSPRGGMLDYLGHDPRQDRSAARHPVALPGGRRDRLRRGFITDGVFQHADGKAKLIALPFVDNNERPDQQFPFWLNSGRVVEHFHTRTRTGKIGNCQQVQSHAVHGDESGFRRELGIGHMTYVRLISRRGYAVVMVQLTHRVPHDMVFIPFHFHDCVNRLTLGLLDPYSRQPAFKQCAVKIEPATDQTGGSRGQRRRAQFTEGATHAQGRRRQARPRFHRARPAAPAASRHAPAFKARTNEPAYALLPPSNGAQSTAGASRSIWSSERDQLAGQSHADQRQRGGRHQSRTATSSTAFISPPTTASAATPARRPAARRTICRRTSAFRSVGYVEGGSLPRLPAASISPWRATIATIRSA